MTALPKGEREREAERETEEETKLIPGEAKTKSRLEHFQTVQTDVRANMDVQRQSKKGYEGQYRGEF